MRNHVKTAVMVILLVGTTIAAQETVELTPLKIELPKPMFIGTPKNIVSDNLEEITGKARGPFLAPAGLTNVALNKPVIASDDEPIIGEIEYVTDGDKYGGEGSFVEFGPGVQWVQIDLGAPHDIFAIVVWHYHSQARVYRDVVVQVGDGPDFIENVRTLFNNDHDNSAGLGIGKTDKEYIETFEGRLIDAGGAVARYLRLYSNGSTANELNHYVEVEVYGRPVSGM